MTISNPDIVRVIKARLEDCRCHGLPVDPQGFRPCGGCEHDGRCLTEIVEARRERDEARRMWCESEPVGNCLSVDDMYRRARVESARRGWDCYKEETP
jgi:hypothetical protein